MRTAPDPVLLSPVRAVALAALVFAPTGALDAQSGEQVLRTLLDRYEERMRGVERYTVVHEVLGSEATTDFEPTRVDGHTVFLPSAGDGDAGATPSDGGFWADLFELAERSRHRGVEEVDGRPCHVVTVSDFRGTAFSGGVPSLLARDVEPTAATLHVDVADHLLRRLEVRGRTGAGDETREVAVAAVFRDYREVEGVLHPFRTDVSVEGLAAGLADRITGPGLEGIAETLSSGTMEFTVRVKEVRVGRPAGGGG